MATARFQLASRFDPATVKAVLTDFGPTRPQLWPTIDADHFRVHALGDTWAEVTEGTAGAWERARYDWSARDRVTIETLDSKLFGAGGGWTFTMTPSTEGTTVVVELVRSPRRLTKRIMAALLPVLAPRSLRKAFAGPLGADL